MIGKRQVSLKEISFSVQKNLPTSPIVSESTMRDWMHNPQQAVMDAKAALLARMPDVAHRMRRLDEGLADEVAAVQAEGADAVPQLAYRDVVNGAVSAAERLRIRRRGCVIIRNVFDAPQASE